MRRAASRIHLDVELDRKLRSDSKPLATVDRLLVCVGPSPSTARVIRTAKRMATALDAQWLAVSVDTSSVQSQMRVAQHFRLAERLGAETVTLAGDDVVGSILEFARSRNVTKIFVGKTNQAGWKRFFQRSVVDQLLASSGGIDIYVINGERNPRDGLEFPHTPVTRINLNGYAYAVVITLASGLVASWLRRLFVSNPETNTA